MALSRLLLLCVLASEVWDAQTNRTDFVCNRSARRAMNIVAEMQSSLSDCNGTSILSLPVRLPCTELRVASWESKSHQEKIGDISASLRLLVEGVKVVRSLSQGGCGALLLQRLEHNINNYLLILTHLQPSEQAENPLLSCVPQSTLSLSTVLLNYNRLISGKLERFMRNMEDRCVLQ